MTLKEAQEQNWARLQLRGILPRLESLIKKAGLSNTHNIKVNAMSSDLMYEMNMTVDISTFYKWRKANYYGSPNYAKEELEKLKEKWQLDLTEQTKYRRQKCSI